MYDMVTAKILARTESIFKEDYAKHHDYLADVIDNSRILVIGAAGSIGAAFVRQLSRFSIRTLHLVDISENNLVEVVRDLQSSLIALPDDFKTFAIAMGTLEFDRFIDTQKSYDYVINFSALKHVRSEKDPYTLMRMYNTNIFYFERLLNTLKEQGTKKVFAVSSDKAVNPASIMGATKLFMERVLQSYSEKIPFSTARFANVAFSDGSLPFGFVRRMEKKQPLSAPSDVKRFFISHAEAGQLCMLACFRGENNDVFFPQLSQDSDMTTFSEIAEIFLEERNLKAKKYDSEGEARKAASQWKPGDREYPCCFFKSDTTGEKMFEEFYLENDKVDFDTYKKIGILQLPPFSADDSLHKAMERFEIIKNMKTWSKEDMVEAIRIVIPELEHEERSKNLDQKM